MTIKTKLLILATLPIIIILVAGFAGFLARQQVTESFETQNTIDEVAQGVFELNLLTSDYVLLRQERAKLQWQAAYQSLGDKISQLAVATPQEQAAVDKLTDTYEYVGALFSELVDVTGRQSPEYEELTRVLATQLLVDSQSMVTDCNILSDVAAEEFLSARQRGLYVFWIGVGLVVVAALLASFLIYRSIAKPIRELKEGTKIIGAGNLNHKVDTAAKDEIGELSRAFNQMTKKLKVTTVSRDQLTEEVAERKRMEAVLQQSERNYRTLFDTALEGVAVIDGETLRVVICNQNAVSMFGFDSPEEAIGLDPLSVIHPDDIERTAKIMLQNGFGKDLRAVNEFRLIAKDGRQLWVSAVGAITKYQGSPAMMVSFRDITQRKHAEDALRQSEERYRTILEDMEDSYFEVDLAGNLTFTNNSTCRNLRYSRKELIGQNFKAFTAEEDAKAVYQAFNRVYRTGKPVKALSWKVVRKDGNIGFAEAVVFPLRNQEGEIVGFRGVGRDVTEHKRMEEERRELEQKAYLASRLASVGEIASGIAHEINNPLTGVIGYAQLLMGRDIPEDIRNDVKTIYDGGQRVASIINRLLTFARQYKPQQDYVIINDIIATTLNLRAYELETTNIKTNLRLDRDLPATIADAGQLQQVFLNLIINAETEMKLAHGTGKLSIKTEAIDNTIRVSFKDDGPGVAKENLDKIFDPFFTTREVGQGTGLGLSICHGIIAEHGGRIYAESKLGKGATFIVELPIVTEPKQMELAEPAADEAQKMAKAKILVVDDEPTILQFLSQLLTDEGHEVETVDNADDALEMVESKRYSLILLDIKMPGMSGMELYKRIQRMAKSLARRVVFITGDVIGAETTAFLSQTKARYITKPFDAEQLKKEINRILTQNV